MASRPEVILRPGCFSEGKVACKLEQKVVYHQRNGGESVLFLNSRVEDDQAGEGEGRGSDHVVAY